MRSKMRKVLTCQCEHEATSTHSRTFAVVSRKPLNNRNLSHIKTFEMNKTSTFLVAGAMFAAMTSCSESDVYLCGCNADKEQCQLSISEVNKEGYRLTRTATEKESFVDGDALGVWVDDIVNDTYNGTVYSNIKVTKGTNGWTFLNNVALTSSKARVYAVYPYNEKMQDKKVTLSVDDDTDYLYDVVSNASNTNPTVQLTMKHIRSKLVVKVKRGDYTGDGVITTGTVSGSSMMLNGSFDVKTEKFQSTEGSGTLSFTGTVSGEGMLEDQWFVFSKFGGSASKLSFNLTIDGIKYPTAQSTEGVIFEKGKKYIYTLTISNHKVEVSKVDIEPWTDGKDEDVTITD